jgi:hypothetical protein
MFFFFVGMGIWLRQVLYHLTHVSGIFPLFFALVIFQVESRVFVLSRPQSVIILPMASH